MALVVLNSVAKKGIASLIALYFSFAFHVFFEVFPMRFRFLMCNQKQVKKPCGKLFDDEYNKKLKHL